MKPKVLITQNSAFVANRLPRAARALKEAGYDVEILTWDRGINKDTIRKASSQFEKEGIIVHTIYCGITPYGKGIKTLIQKIKFILHVISFLMRNSKRYSVIHAIDFDLAFPVYVTKKISRKISYKIIYDIADFVETFHSPMPKVIRKFITRVSNSIMKECAIIIVPDHNRYINIPKEFHNKVLVINNSIDPPTQTYKFPLTVDKSKINIFYYGALSQDRGIELLLESSCMGNVCIWIAGKGELENEIILYSNQHENVNFLGYLELSEVLSVASQLDLIYMAYDPSFQHNQLASPNKLFEAFYLGKPCIVVKGTSIDLLVSEKNIGYVISYDSNDLINTLSQIDKNELVIKGLNAKTLYKVYSWENTKTRLVSHYKKLLNNGDSK